MGIARKIILGLVSMGFLVVHQARAAGACDVQGLMHQQKDAATIQQLEKSWTIAIAQGDTSFERCLLTPDFVEVMSTGEIKTLADELGNTAKNKGQHRPPADMPQVTVSIHDNVAVAYATWKPADASRKPDLTSDFFVWDNGSWRVFFSQSTRVSGRKGSGGEEDSGWHMHSLAQVIPK
jgi:hypothetical protein